MLNIEVNKTTGEQIYKTTLSNGLKIFICPKVGYTKKIGMYGTIYGSLDSEFIDVITGKRTKVEDGIAHFLEHKLFEQEGDNALDVFAKMGVSSNAYTAFDHTVYFFETSDKFDTCIEKLLEFVNAPYFTDENVEKEKGIIGQEIRMYDDDANAVVYYNTLRAMYKEHPLKVDIAGTVESVNNIYKEALYSCYNTFYNPANMFVIVIGDVNVEETLKLIENQMLKREAKKVDHITRYIAEESKEIACKEIQKELDVYMPYICMGFKHERKDGKTNAKNTAIVDIIDGVCFSSLSDFYEEMYNGGFINEPMQIVYESGESFAHTVIFLASKKYKECEQKLREYIETLRRNGIENSLFEIVKKKKIGEAILDTEDSMQIHRQIIDSIIQKTDVFEYMQALQSITKQDIDEFIKLNLNEENMVISRVIEKNEK